MESIDKKYYKIKEEKLYQKVIAKTYKCNIQQDETLEGILKRQMFIWPSSSLLWKVSLMHSSEAHFCLLFLILFIKT